MGDTRDELLPVLPLYRELELEVLEYLEPLIASTTPYEVVHLCTGDQTDCIVLLTAAERERLQRERPALFDFESAYT